MASAQTTSMQSNVGVQSPMPNIPSKIEIGTLPALIAVVAFLVGIGVAWGSLKTLMQGIKKTLDNKIEPDLKDVRERFCIVEDRVESLWKDKYAPANSPRQLNPKGSEVLEKSGIKEIVDEKKDKLLELIKKKEVKNAYDAEMAITRVMMGLPKHCPDIVERLKTGAFNTGVDIDAVLFVGGIYLRNIIFKDLGFSLDDLDKPKEIAAKQ